MRYHGSQSANNLINVKWLNFVSPEEERVKRFQQQVNSGLVSLTRPRDVRVRDTEKKTTPKVVFTSKISGKTLIFSPTGPDYVFVLRG
jgi:hypothetical protein